VDIENKTQEEINISNDSFNIAVKFSGIPPITFNSHKLMQFLPLEGKDAAYEVCLAFIRKGKREHHFLTLSGQPGRGKTHLALGIGWHWLENKMGDVKYWQVAELLDKMRSEFDNPPKDNYGFPLLGALEKAKKTGLLILDDLGAESGTPWAKEKLDELINYRYIEQKPTVFTTNLSGEQLPPRLASRLKEGVVVVIMGEDYRERIARKRRNI